MIPFIIIYFSLCFSFLDVFLGSSEGQGTCVMRKRKLSSGSSTEFLTGILKQLISFGRSITCNIQASVVRKVDTCNSSVVCFANSYPLESNLCGG